MSSLAVDGRSFSVAGALGGELSTGWGRLEEVVGVGDEAEAAGHSRVGERQ